MTHKQSDIIRNLTKDLEWARDKDEIKDLYDTGKEAVDYLESAWNELERIRNLLDEANNRIKELENG